MKCVQTKVKVYNLIPFVCACVCVFWFTCLRFVFFSNSCCVVGFSIVVASFGCLTVPICYHVIRELIADAQTRADNTSEESQSGQADTT